MAKICFVTYEIHPVTQGGCGVLLNNAARVLLSEGQEVIFLLDVPEFAFRQFNDYDRLNLPNSHQCRAYHVETLTKDMEYSRHNFRSSFEFRSYRFDQAAHVVNQLEAPDIIEFFEYCGVAYHAISKKVSGLDYQNTHITLRLHNSLELIDRQQSVYLHDFDRFLMYDLEHQALRLAESILIPSASYLEKAYRSYYESWFGKSIYSKPPLIDGPRFITQEGKPNFILFYSRLVGFKGVDLFVDAAILYLTNPHNPRREFILVGLDSFFPPGDFFSYKEYLESKIPPSFSQDFHFKGHLSWIELGELLPQVLFAVIPSYFESFCYAAHELYETGIPLILSDIPAFEDYFQDEENALLFDGTVSDLTNQITRLSRDDKLRKKITHPFSVIQNPLGNFYNSLLTESWIRPNDTAAMISLLVLIVCDQSKGAEATLREIASITSLNVQVFFLIPFKKSDSQHIPTWFLGNLYYFTDPEGTYKNPTDIFTLDALLILKAGDIPKPDFIKIGLSTLQSQSQISFVGCWKQFREHDETTIDTFPLDAALEIIPFIGKSAFHRVIMRTVPGKLLIDLFDPRSGQLGELMYLWQLDTDSSSGIVIPEPLLFQNAEESEPPIEGTALDYLVIRDANIWRKNRLARFLLTLPNRNTIFKETITGEISKKGSVTAEQSILDNTYDSKRPQSKWLEKLRQSEFNRTLNKFPRMKALLRKAVNRLLKISPPTSTYEQR